MTDPVYRYEGEFNPQTIERSKQESDAGDLRRHPVYVYTEEIKLRVNVALATRRPILVRGPSGCGKSSLARSAAQVLGWRYYERVITSRTQARDLLWEVDLLRRLHDAQVPKGKLTEDYAPYIEPGPLWWAFDRKKAEWRGEKQRSDLGLLRDPAGDVDHARAVVLLDEIDKADPDVPNNLLVPLGSLQFEVEETGLEVKVDKGNAPLVFITSNDERELPPAFLRRCVALELDWPTPARLLEIGKAQFPQLASERIMEIAEILLGKEKVQAKSQQEVELSPAEFVDAIRAITTLSVSSDDLTTLDAIASSTIWKHGRSPEPRR